MIKKVIHTADIHIRNTRRLDEYEEQLTRFIDKCREIAQPYEKEEVRILICGDIIHQKNTINPTLLSMVAWFIRQLQEICKVIVIAGNHDLVVNNTASKDAISSIFEAAAFENAFLLDYELGGESGCVVDDNITWAVYSIYNDYLRPDIEKAKEENPTNTVIGLYHGTIVGATLNNGSLMESGVDGEIFHNCNCVMAGDIHKHQYLKRGDTEIVYSGSLIQQNFGETLTQHGFEVWNIEDLTHDFIELETEYGLYDFEIKDITDVDNDKEFLRNY